MTEQTPHFYKVSVDWTKEKMGNLSSEGLPTMEVATPPEFNGHPGIWTPEHLYVASINSCFMSTFLAITSFSKLEFSSFQSEATGKLEKVDNVGLQITEVTIHSKLVIKQESDLKKAGSILEKAKKNCLISNSIKTTVNLKYKIELS